MQAAEKLRYEGLFASGIAVHIRTLRQQAFVFMNEEVELPDWGSGGCFIERRSG